MVTGSLAADNTDEGADIDFLFTYPAERTWTSYAAVRLMAKLPVGGLSKLCPNYVLSDAALEIRPQNIFTAWEVAKAIPMFGFDVYREFVRANQWVSRYLPNALPEAGPIESPRVRRPSPLTQLSAFEWLEAQEKKRKYATDRRDVGVDMHERARKGSMDRHSPTRSFHALSELRYRMRQLSLEAHPHYAEVAAATGALGDEMSRWGADALVGMNGANGTAKKANGAHLSR
jgi:hypothetical protein